MRRMGLIFVYWLVLLPFAIADTTKTNITTASGTVYSNVVVTRVDANGLTMTRGNRVFNIPFSNLTPEVQSAYGYDAEKAGRYKVEREKDALRLEGKVSQVFDKGILVYGDLISSVDATNSLAQAELAEKQLKEIEKDMRDARIDYYNELLKKKNDLNAKISALKDEFRGMYYVAGVKTKDFVDGDEFQAWVYYAGRFQYYVSAIGRKKTVRRYATSRELAQKLLAAPESKEE